MSTRLWAIAGTAGVVVLAAIGYVLSAASSPTAGPALAAGQELYAANCAGCHGSDLEGQADWQTPLPNGRMPAPPHNASGHTWHHSDRQLFTIVKYGLQGIEPGYQSDMPAFEGTLGDEEIRAVLEYIKSTWPERERAYQAERSRADQG